MKEIRDDIKMYLENITDYNYSTIKFEIGKILKNHNISNFLVTCDNTNNYLDIDKFIKIDIRYYTNMSLNCIVNNITIIKDELELKRKALRKLRKNKLEEIYGI